jgi:hypothetical protein
MADYTSQHIGSRTQSKMHNLNVNYLRVQNLFFPLNDAIYLKDMQSFKHKIWNQECGMQGLS